MSTFTAIDEQILYFVNHDLANTFTSAVIPLLRDKHTWLPLYIALLAYLIINFKWKAIWFAVVIILTVTITDSGNSKGLKKIFERSRPCKELHLQAWLNVPVGCSGGLSFPSTHAANHMGIATLLVWIFGARWGKWKYVILLWAFTIGFAQVFVGVHYPFDVLAGFLVGAIVGTIVYFIFRKKLI